MDIPGTVMGIPGFIHFIDNKMQHELGMLSGEHFRGIDTPKILEKYSFVRDLMHDYLVQFRNDDMKSERVTAREKELATINLWAILNDEIIANKFNEFVKVYLNRNDIVTSVNVLGGILVNCEGSLGVELMHDLLYDNMRIAYAKALMDFKS